MRLPFLGFGRISSQELPTLTVSKNNSKKTAKVFNG